MRPACLDNPNIRCRWDDDTDHCPCHEPEPPARPIDNIDPGEYL